MSGVNGGYRDSTPLLNRSPGVGQVGFVRVTQVELRCCGSILQSFGWFPASVVVSGPFNEVFVSFPASVVFQSFDSFYEVLGFTIDYYGFGWRVLLARQIVRFRGRGSE